MSKLKDISPPHKLLEYDPLIKWEQQEASTKLDELYHDILSLADSTIGWFQSYRSRKGKWAKGIRITAIVFLILSTLTPVVASVCKEDSERYILYGGYLCAVLGGCALLMDRYYGYSNSWIRFILTGMNLEAMRNSFIEHWQIIRIQNLPLTKDTFCFLVNEISRFRESYVNVVKADTEIWAKEFQQSFKDLISALKTQSDQLKTAFEESKEAIKSNAQKDSDIPSEIFQEAIKEKYEEWKSWYKIIGASYGIKIKDGDPIPIKCLVFIPHTKIKGGQEVFNPIPPVIPFHSSNGITYNLPTDVRPAGSAFRAAVNQCDRDIPKRPGCSISRINDDKKENTGTIGLKVYKGEQSFILSCYHVLCALELEQGRKRFTSPTAEGSAIIISPSKEDSDDGIELGEVTDGEFNHQLDGAIMLIKDTISLQDKLCTIDRRPGEALAITEDHAKNHHPVISVGRTSGIMNGTIELHDTICDVDYFIDHRIQSHRFHHVILTNQLSKGGDSGAAVIDTNNNVIGILAATSTEFSCIIPIERLLTRFSITLKPNI